jgi:hypothetical protein
MPLYTVVIHFNPRNILDILVCKAEHAYYIRGCNLSVHNVSL